MVRKNMANYEGDKIYKGSYREGSEGRFVLQRVRQKQRKVKYKSRNLTVYSTALM